MVAASSGGFTVVCEVCVCGRHRSKGCSLTGAEGHVPLVLYVHRSEHRHGVFVV